MELGLGLGLGVGWGWGWGWGNLVRDGPNPEPNPKPNPKPTPDLVRDGHLFLYGRERAHGDGHGGVHRRVGGREDGHHVEPIAAHL